MSMKESVSFLTDHDFRVFPIIPNGNKPTIKKWPERASTDPLTFENNWTASPPHNIGIATGNTFIVIDVDSKEHGGKHDGIATYNAIKDEFPTTFTVQTPSGGLHLYYRTTPEQIEELDIKTRSAWLPGIDIRSNGGYVVGPGSIKPEGEYKIIQQLPNSELVQLPVELFRKIKARSDKKKSTSNSVTSSLITSETSQFSSMPEVIPMGQRDETLFKYACSWRERGTPYEMASILMAELHKRCEASPLDPITLADAVAKLDRAWTEYVPGEQAAPPAALVEQQEQMGFEAPARPASLEEALKRFIYVEERDSVADLDRHPKQALTKLGTWKTLYKNVRVSQRELPAAWLANRDRQSVRDTMYQPSASKIINYQGEQFFNTYVGNDLASVKYDGSKIDTFLDHMTYMFPAPAERALIMNWLIFTVVHPEKRIPWAPLVMSKPGVGKSWLYLVLQKLLGDENCSLICDSDLESNHNGYLSEKTLVCLDDVENGKQLHVTMNSILTAPTLIINHKYGGMGTEKMFFNFICFTNPGRAIALQDNDRRFWVNESSAIPKSSDYYTELHDWLETDGPAHLYKWMKTQDLSKFSYAAAPATTAAKQDMMESSLSIFEEIIHNGIKDKSGPFIADIVDRNVVETYIKMDLGRDNLTNGDLLSIRKALARYATRLPQDRYSVNLTDSTNGSKTYSLRVIRDAERWQSATAGSIVEEYKKGFKSLMGIK